jgi:hypothetical protein
MNRMMRKWFEMKRQYIGCTMNDSQTQEMFDGLLLGERKACLVKTGQIFRSGSYFGMAFDVYSVFRENDNGERFSEMEQIHYGNKLIVKKGTDVSSAIYQENGIYYIREEGMEQLLQIDEAFENPSWVNSLS